MIEKNLEIGVSSVSERGFFFHHEGKEKKSNIIQLPLFLQTYSSSAGSQAQVSKFMSIVLDALVTSVACIPPSSPPVRLYNSQLSMVPKRSVSVSEARLTLSTLSSNHRSFTALKYVERGKPHRRWKCDALLDGVFCVRSETRSLVRASNHTMALCSGFPVVASQATVVSR